MDSAKSDRIRQLILSEISKLESISEYLPYQKLNIINNIIESSRLIDNSIDINIFNYKRMFIEALTCSTDDPGEGYYDYKKLNAKIISLLDGSTIEEKIALINYYNRALKDKEFESFPKEISRLKKRLEIQLLSKKWFKNFFLLIYLFCSRDLKSLLFSLFILYLIYSILLLPAIFPMIACLKIEYVEYYDNFILNHLCNTIGSICDIDSDFKIIPMNAVGVLFMCITKCITIGIILSFITNQIKEELK